MRKRWTPHRAVPGPVTNLSILNYLSNDTRSLLSPGQCPSIWKNHPPSGGTMAIRLIYLDLSPESAPRRSPRLGRCCRQTAKNESPPPDDCDGGGPAFPLPLG